MFSIIQVFQNAPRILPKRKSSVPSVFNSFVIYLLLRWYKNSKIIKLVLQVPNNCGITEYHFVVVIFPNFQVSLSSVFVLTLFKVTSDFFILFTKAFHLSSSCNSTTVVGVISRPYFLRILSSSNSSGILASTSLAIFSIKSSRLMPDELSPVYTKQNYIKFHPTIIWLFSIISY